MHRGKIGPLRVAGIMAFAFLLLLQGCSVEEPTQRGGKPPVAPDFALPDLQGKTVRLSDFGGKVIILDFWATWCPPCREEIPHFVELYSQYRNHGFQMIGISLDAAGPAVVKEFARKYGINYPILMADDQVALQYGGIPGIPTTFVIDRQGKVSERHVGYREKETFEKALRSLL
ncbi:MAG: TlpA family protein disulfide reductase [Candidatus Tectomicrobia bacterium]|uniref:TlpA family protein disulfide reductase n=1 Tax=Tectimicrobiota bacterium TaxID=2528274 RepID=A0A932FW11_UNCTE|nr:TlpA family protein disulfide reductase [Candidatus Tectomicrobia bacterium]